MTWKTKKCMYWSPLYPEKTLVKSKGGSMKFSDIQKYLTWLKLQECKKKPWFQITPKICMLNFSIYQKLLLEIWHVIISNQCKNLHIGPKWQCQLEIGYTTLHFFQNQHTHYQIDLALFINNIGRTQKTKLIQQSIYIFISISISCVCRLAHCTTFAKWQGWYTICWDNWGTKLGSFSNNWLSSIVSNMEHCQQMQAGEGMFWGHQRRWVWPQQTT